MTDFRPGRFQVLPTVVKNLIIINVILVVAQFVFGRAGVDLADYLGLHYWKSSLFKPWQLITHMFMHGSFDDINGTITHIFFNMFSLWMFGSILENLWGPKRFLIFYLICGLGAALLHLGVLGFEYNALADAFNQYQDNPTLDQYLLFIRKHGLDQYQPFQDLALKWEDSPSSIGFANNSNSLINQYITLKVNEATVGASGAVFGILFAFGYLFPNTLLYLYFLVPIKAKYVVGAFVLIELFSGIRNSAGDNVAHFAHLGGMLVAFILLKVWNKHNRQNFY